MSHCTDSRQLGADESTWIAATASDMATWSSAAMWLSFLDGLDGHQSALCAEMPHTGTAGGERHKPGEHSAPPEARPAAQSALIGTSAAFLWHSTPTYSACSSTL